MRANPHRDMVLPDESWDAKRKDIKLGGTTVEMHYVGMSHGLGMTVFRVANQKVAYIADIVTPNRVLFTIVPDFNGEIIQGSAAVTLRPKCSDRAVQNIVAVKFWWTATGPRRPIFHIDQYINLDIKRPRTLLYQTVH